MESTRLLAGIREISVREHVRKFFNQESFDGKKCRDMIMMGFIALMMMEVMIWVLLQHSADLGELPHNITDAVVIGISSLEVLLAPLLCWLGMQRRRSVMVGWILLCLITALPLFALPKPETTQDAGLCSDAAPRSFPTGISTKAAVRLSLLIISGLACALGRTAITGHGLAYIDEHTPSVNLHMHVGILVLYRVMPYLLGSAIDFVFIEKAWIQLVLVVVQLLLVLLRMFTYPEIAPRVEKLPRSDRGLFRSMGRVLSNSVVVLLILAMALVTAAWWGFRMHEADFVQVKYNLRPEFDQKNGFATLNLKYWPVLLAVILYGYLYTVPVMPKYDRKAAATQASVVCVGTVVMYVVLTAALSCAHAGVAGAGDAYSQPACSQTCGCDRPWMEFSPVCVQEQITTYFSPCHAGCASSEVVNSVRVYSNCTCAPGGRVTVGPCTDGSCESTYGLHEMVVMVISTFSALALVWMITVVLETVDKRDVAVAVGLMSSVISLFTFVGAHGFYMGISSFTCTFNRGSKCLFQNSAFVSWIGYSSAVLVGIAVILSITSCIILRIQKEPKEEDTDAEPI